MLPAARPLSFAATQADVILATGLWIVTGWSFVETTGGADASLEVLDGRAPDSTFVGAVNLTQGESTRDLMGANGVACHVGVFVHVLAGTVKGAVWAIPAQDYRGFAWARGIRPVWAGDER